MMRIAVALCALLCAATLARAATFTVTTADDDGPGTLRQAILDANVDTDPDMIVFSIGSGAQTIVPASALPIVTSPVTFDGTTQPGFAGAPLIEIDGENVPPNAASDPSGNGEGEGPLGTTMVTTDLAGHGVIEVLLPVALDPGSFVTATATDPMGNTSELSAALQVGSVPTTSTSSTSTEEPTTTTSSTSTSSTSTTIEPTTTSTTTTSSSTSTEEPTTTTSSTSTSSTSTTIEPTTTSTSTTLEPTTSTSSTTGAPTTTTSTTVGPSTSTTNPPVVSTTTTTAPVATTTTTLPCSMAQPLPGIVCRINALAVRVGQESALDVVQAKLQTRLDQAIARVEEAREGCLLRKTGLAKRKLGRVSKALAQFSKTLRSRKARTVPQALRDELTTTAEVLRGDVGLVKIALVCG